jgi:hypothetical protein
LKAVMMVVSRVVKLVVRMVKLLDMIVVGGKA